MPDLLVQFLGLFALLGITAWGYRRWIRPREIDLQGSGMLLLILVTLVGGVLGATGWWLDDPRSFAWDLPPLASRMLASAGLAFGVATFAALQRPTVHRVRLALLMLAVYLAPLFVAIPLFHLDRFDLSAPITYAFFAIVVPMTVAVLWYLLRQPTIVEDTPDDSLPSRPPNKLWLGLVAVASAAWGLALFVTDSGPSALVWAWSGDLLTGRLVAVMLLTIAVGAAYALRYADASRVMLAVTVVYGLGVVLANLWSVLAAKPVNPAYVAAFGIMSAGSAVTLVLDLLGAGTRTRSAKDLAGGDPSEG